MTGVTISNGLLHFSRPLLFTGLSMFFLVVYLALANVGRHHESVPVPVVSVLESSDTYESPDEKFLLCNSSFQDNRPLQRTEKLPVIYFVTPTYSRAVQLAELTRLGQTLRSVPALHWILVEDSETCSPALGRLLSRFGMPYTHMASPMPSAFQKSTYKPRGVSNRRAALQWIRNNPLDKGVLYFGDDDNTYDLRLFDEIRDTAYISMFPVGLVGEYGVSSPVVQDGKVVGFYDSWPAGRRFAIDMAGFAVNIDLLHQFPNATMIYKAGYEEDHFLRGLHLDPELIEAKASNCSEILVWHTKTVQVVPASLRPFGEMANPNASIGKLLNFMSESKLVTFSKKGKASQVNYFVPLA